MMIKQDLLVLLSVLFTNIICLNLTMAQSYVVTGTGTTMLTGVSSRGQSEFSDLMYQSFLNSRGVSPKHIEQYRQQHTQSQNIYETWENSVITNVQNTGEPNAIVCTYITDSQYQYSIYMKSNQCPRTLEINRKTGNTRY